MLVTKNFAPAIFQYYNYAKILMKKTLSEYCLCNIYDLQFLLNRLTVIICSFYVMFREKYLILQVLKILSSLFFFIIFMILFCK